MASEEKKVGRPKVKAEECKTINIAMPVSMLKKTEVAKLAYNGNLTEYVNHCVAADLDAHYEEYLTIYNIAQRTTMSLSITKDDKMKLQEYAIREGKTAASIIHKWIQENCD